MKKMLLVAAIAAIGTAAEAVNLTPADYVQDGLIVQFDAIDNEGTGTHNPSATKWTALKGGASITLQSGASWVGGNYLDTTKAEHVIAGMPAFNRNSLTIETALDIIDKGKKDGQTDTPYPRLIAATACSIHFNNTGSDAQFYMVDYPDKRPIARSFSGGTISGYSGATRYAVAVDGVERDTSLEPVALNVGKPKGNWTLNGLNGFLHGHYYAFRYYNRMLAPDEIARNAVIDKIRFRNTMPDGYRDNGGALQQRFFVKRPTEGGTVKVDSQTLSADFEEWAAFGTSATHTLEATAAEGHVFQRWTGDMTAITSGNFYSNRITATRSVATSLAPLFTAIPTPAMTAPTVEIDVGENATAVLDDWLAAHPDVTIGTSGTIVKTGKGTLQVTNDVIETFAGDIVIRQGRWFAGVRKGLGAMNGGDVWVNDGATLHVYTKTLAEVNASSKQITRKVYVKGTGTDGKGALFGSAAVNDELQWVFPKYVTLLGDTRIEGANHVNFVDMFVDMNRFTVTLSPAVYDWQRLNSGCWSNGNIRVISKTLLVNADRRDPFGGGGAENVVRFTSSSGYRANTYAVAANSPQGRWTAIFENNAYLYGPNKNGSGAGWNGPMILEGDTRFNAQDYWTKMLFWGPISGPGNLGKATTDIRYNIITLANANNSFTGGIWLKRQSLEAKTDGAIPANGAALSSDNSTVYLSAAMEYHLPDLALSGTGSVYSVAATTGSFKNATKSGNSVITWNTKVGAKSFALNGGTLKFGAQAAAADFGRFSAANGTTLDLSGASWTCTNLTGAATLVDGTLTVNGPWTLNPASVGTLGGGTATVAFGPNTVLSLANMAGLNRQTVYTIATSATAFAAPLPVDAATKAAHWRVKLSADGRSQELFYNSGITIVFR